MAKTLKEKIEVMQAAEDGKAIEQVLPVPNRQDTWCRVTKSSVGWDWSHCDYRVKREPKAIYVNEYSNPLGMMYGVYDTEEEAEFRATKNAIKVAVKYIEVIEE